MRVFRDRRDAGRQLADVLAGRYAETPNVVVLALPRGGVPVGYEIAARLGAPLDVLIVRKLGVPGHEELAMGAIASGGVQVIDYRLVRLVGASETELARIVDRERLEVVRRERLFRGDRPPLDVTGRTVIIVDDGLATGATMLAAIKALRTRGPGRVVVAVPVAAPEACRTLRAHVDDTICLATPDGMRAVGLWYEDFEQTSDGEVRELLDRAPRPQAQAPLEMSY
jgi:putative phosphoribosyl transferase